MAILIALFLTISMSASVFLQPYASAHTPGWTIISYPYLVASPNPVGVGQTVAVVMWIDGPVLGASLTNDIRRHDYTLTITAPDGQITSQHWAVVSDSTSIQNTQFTPNEVGNYTLKFDYPSQNYTWTSTTVGANTQYTGDMYTAASKTIT